jgi:hypothetical protein
VLVRLLRDQGHAAGWQPLHALLMPALLGLLTALLGLLTGMVVPLLHSVSLHGIDVVRWCCASLSYQLPCFCQWLTCSCPPCLPACSAGATQHLCGAAALH